jgi:hypothetical protein
MRDQTPDNKNNKAPPEGEAKSFIDWNLAVSPLLTGICEGHFLQNIESKDVTKSTSKGVSSKGESNAKSLRKRRLFPYGRRTT